MVVIVMGVSGCGKTTVGTLLAERLGIPFYDADGFHPEANIKKMSDGVPLTDSDRKPWLEALHKQVVMSNKGAGAVIACSALKNRYRALLQGLHPEPVTFVFLKGSKELILRRLQDRRNHYMPASLLISQFAALEEPLDAVTVSIDKTPEAICEDILRKIRS